MYTKNVWEPILGQMLATAKEEGNSHDKYAISVINL